jgi:hypothetical protein
MSRVRRFCARQIDEIAAQRSLRFCGATLAIMNVLAIQWWFHAGIDLDLSGQAEPICWPLIPDCARLHFLSPRQVALLLRAFQVLCLATAALLARRRTVALGYFAFIAETLAKALLMAIDFRTRMNQHYMIMMVSAVWLLLPNKALFCRLLIVQFYFWAGFLKFNPDWLSGVSLYGPLLWVPERWVPLAMRYGIVLELVVAWGLLPRRPAWLFWICFAQLFAFHVVSSPIVGFFYPMMMIGFLLFTAVERADTAHVPFVAARDWPGVVFLLGFCALQLIPRFISSDSAMSGEGRLWALHMFDGRIDCRSSLMVKLPDGRRALWPPPRDTDVRTSCDPILFWNHARNACRQRPDAHADFDLEVWARHRSDGPGVERRLIYLETFCSSDPRYSLLRHNRWIFPGGR